jgi:predicted Zn-dependent protease
VSPSQDALVVVTLTGAESVNAAVLQFQRETGVRTEGFRRASWSGLDAASAPFMASTEQGTMAGVAAFAALEGKVYRLLGYAPSTRWDAYADTVDLCLSSFGPLRDRRYLDVEPRRIQIVEAPRTMTLDEFAARYPSPVPIKVLATINNARDRLPAGELVKRVVGGRLPD